ncbi:NPCBM/NEW2 domain-containing protein [Candidatus Gottesmanbacteria bacterium]|nr:NPCBM/NEW2 domain-containing protein [Candidatus Gottesmanbacteria bacterium]
MIPRWFWVVLFFALLFRLILIPNPGFEADVSFWKSWGLAVVDMGIIKGVAITNSNYPTPFNYVLGGMVAIYKLFADPHNFNEFWSNTNVLFLAISKAFPVLADFGIAGIIIFLIKSRLGFFLASIYLLNPVSLIDGALWGQIDSLGLFIFLLAFVAVVKKRPMLAGVIFMASMMTKLQNMIYGPLFFLFIWQTLGYEGLIRSISGATLAFFGLNVEFLLTHNMSRVVASLTENFDYFPWMSLNAFNLWWIVSGAKGMQVSDKLLALGIANAKTVGLVLFSSVYLFAILRQFVIRGGLGKTQGHPLRIFLESLILVNAAFFLFQTQSHDRYAFPLSVFLLLWAPFALRQKANGKWQKWDFLFPFSFFLFTIFYFYNLHTALVFNYPLNGLPILSALTHPAITIITSVVLLGLFGIFLVFVARQSHWLVSTIPLLALFALLTVKNLPLITKSPVSLTKFTPYVSEQDYGRPVINMPVGAYFGFNKQAFLSDQYAFYGVGIGTHARSFFNYDIGSHFKKFSTDYGIDTEAGEKGSVVFEIYGDGTLLHRSPKQGRFDLPGHAEVDITGVKILGLVVTDAGDGNTDDHADWLNPKLFP